MLLRVQVLYITNAPPQPLRLLPLLNPRLTTLHLHLTTLPPLPRPLRLRLPLPLRRLLLLSLQPRLGLLKLPAQLPCPNQRHNQKPHPAQHHVQDPHRAQTVRERLLRHLPAGLGQRVDELGVCARAGTGQRTARLLAHCGDDLGLFCAHFVLVDDAAYDDGDGGRELADEAEGRGSGGDVAGFDAGLEGDEGGLEEGADAEACDELVDDDFG